MATRKIFFLCSRIVFESLAEISYLPGICNRFFLCFQAFVVDVVVFFVRSSNKAESLTIYHFFKKIELCRAHLNWTFDIQATLINSRTECCAFDLEERSGR